MDKRVLAACLFIAVSAGATEAPNVPDYSEEVVQELLRAEIAINTITEMRRRNEITNDQLDRAVLYELTVARTAAGNERLSIADIEAVKVARDKGWGKRVTGFFTFINIMWTLGIILGAVCIIGVLVAIGVPAALYEVAGYVAALYLIWYGMHQPEGVREYFTFFGTLLLVGMPFATSLIHKIDMSGVGYCVMVFVISAISAIVCQNAMIGWIAAIAYMGVIGFSDFALIGGPLFGFDGDDDIVGRATTAGLLTVAVFVGLDVWGAENVYSNLFKDGMLWIGATVGFPGLLAISTRWYHPNRSWLLKQIIALGIATLALLAGSVLQIPDLQEVAGTFFVFYVIEKFFEIPADSLVGYLSVGILIGGVMFLTAWYIKANAVELAPYVLWS